MGSTGTKKNRMLEIFFRAMKGENISVKSMADEYGVSCKSISRDLGEIKNFLCENRELTGNTELKYAANSKTYYLEFDNFLQSTSETVRLPSLTVRLNPRQFHSCNSQSSLFSSPIKFFIK